MNSRAMLLGLIAVLAPVVAAEKFDPLKSTYDEIGKLKVGKTDWPQWAGSPFRNCVAEGKNIPIEWDVKTGKNIKAQAKIGSQTYGNPTIANGKVYVGTNNGAAYIERFPVNVDLGCLLCFSEKDLKFLWQHSSTKLPTGRVHDWPQQGICCAPYVDGNRLWYVTSRGTVVCLDTEGFLDNENDGPYTGEKVTGPLEADVVWEFDMMKDLDVSQHNMCSCSVTCAGDTLFVCTGNGVDEGHINIPAPNAPSFFAMDRKTGKVLWTDNSPGVNVLHGQWSSPSYGVLGGVPQVLFAGGDGWLYSFHGTSFKEGKPELLWKFDGNPKDSKYELSGRSTRNHFIGTPVIYDGQVYIALGEDPEHGEGNGHLFCIDPTKRGDVSPQLVFNKKDPSKPIPHKRIQACIADEGDFVKDNPNSAVVWHYVGVDTNKNKELDFEEEMHRTVGTCSIKDDILYIIDLSGLVHCLDCRTGKPYWTHDLLGQSWGSPLIVDGKVYVGDEDGDIVVFKHSKEKEILSELNMDNSVYTTPVVANNILYIANRSTLFAIETKKE